MLSDGGTALYRQLYGLLLRFYPRTYRERFGPELGQTFNDLCRERTAEGKGLFGYMLWVFSDTFIGVLSVNTSFIFSFIVMHSKHILRPALITGLILLIPFVAMQVSGDWDWSGMDFILMGALIFGTCLAYELVARTSSNVMYRLGVGVAVVTALALYWVNLAVGIIGDGENVATLLFFFVPWVGVLGAIISRLKPRGMSITLFATALAQMLAPVLALVIWSPDVTPWGEPGVVGIFMLSGFFALMFAASGLLFMGAADSK